MNPTFHIFTNYTLHQKNKKMSIKTSIYRIAIFSAIEPVIQKSLKADKLINFDLVLLDNYQNTGKILQVLKADYLIAGQLLTAKNSAFDEDNLTGKLFEKITGLLPTGGSIISLSVKKREKEKTVVLNYKLSENCHSINL